jgi:hypothetical protein
MRATGILYALNEAFSGSHFLLEMIPWPAIHRKKSRAAQGYSMSRARSANRCPAIESDWLNFPMSRLNIPATVPDAMPSVFPHSASTMAWNTFEV